MGVKQGIKHIYIGVQHIRPYKLELGAVVSYIVKLLMIHSYIMQ
jgi:hypothetical protein